MLVTKMTTPWKDSWNISQAKQFAKDFLLVRCNSLKLKISSYTIYIQRSKRLTYQGSLKEVGKSSAQQLCEDDIQSSYWGYNFPNT